MSLLNEHYNNRKIQMLVGGKPALVPMRYVKDVANKQKAIAEAVKLNDAVNNCDGLPREILREQLHKVMGRIQRLNRKIPPCVQFI